MNRLGKTLCILLGLYFSLLVFDSVHGLSTCFFPEPVGRNQLDGLTCEWPKSSRWRISDLTISVLGILLVAWAWGGSQKAKRSLAALSFAIGLSQVVNEVMMHLYIGYAPLSLESALFITVPFAVGILLIYFSKPRAASNTTYLAQAEKPGR